MGTQVSMNEEVPEFLVLESRVDSVISSVETEVSEYDQPPIQLYVTLIKSLIWTTLFVTKAMIFNSDKDFCCSSSYFHKSLAAFFVFYVIPFSGYWKDHDYLKVMIKDNSHIFSFLSIFFTVRARSTLCYYYEQDIC